jgi:hypothetical protein
MNGSPRSDGQGLPTCRGGRIWIDSISAKRTQFEGAGVEAIDKIFVRHPALLEGSIGPGPRRPGEIASLRRPQPNIVTQIPA